MSIDVETNIRLRCHCEGECWHWRSDAKSMQRKRHPQILVDGKPQLVRRVLFLRAGRKLPEGSFLTPHCRNRFCVNPAHQTLMSAHAKNVAAAKLAKRSPTRAAKVAAVRRAQGLNKLTQAQVDEIRASEEPAKVLAVRMNCDPTNITLIRRGDTWRDYSNPFADALTWRPA